MKKNKQFIFIWYVSKEQQQHLVNNSQINKMEDCRDGDRMVTKNIIQRDGGSQLMYFEFLLCCFPIQFVAELLLFYIRMLFCWKISFNLDYLGLNNWLSCFCFYYHDFYVQVGTSIVSNGCLYDNMQYSTLTPPFYVSFIIIKY